MSATDGFMHIWSLTLGIAGRRSSELHDANRQAATDNMLNIKFFIIGSVYIVSQCFVNSYAIAYFQ